MSRFPGEDFDDAVDRLTDETQQRELDDANEAKRHALGMSPEELSLQDAFLAGMRDGLNGVAAGCNPYSDPHCPEYQEWERGRRGAEAIRLSNLTRRAA